MKKKWGTLSIILSSAAFCVLILDAKTALKGAQDGVALCLQSVIPSLLPFIFISLVLNASITGRSLRLIRPLCRLLGIAEGMESVLLLGFLGGYPIGAQSVNDAFVHGYISRSNAQRLLGFCNNAGPAFIFGIARSLFPETRAVWWLWGIHVASALMVGVLLPVEKHPYRCTTNVDPMSLPKAIENAVRIMARICGWVIIFRVLISFSENWFLWLFPIPYQALFCGILELTNGIYALIELPLFGQRYIIASVILAFGGICVSMQTIHVTQAVGKSLYFPGKLIQTVISFLLAAITQHFIFSPDQILRIPLWMFLLCSVLLCVPAMYLHRKKSCSITKGNVV